MDRDRILVLIEEHAGPELLTLAADLLGPRDGALIALTVVEAPLGRHPATGAAAARTARRRLRRLAAEAHLTGAQVDTRVRAAHSRAAGVREVADEERPDLLVLAALPDGSLSPAARDLAVAPPCDTVVARVAGDGHEIRSVLVPARGGPIADLALSLGLAVATRHGTQLTLLHLDAPGRTMPERAQEERLFRALLGRSSYPRLRSATLPAADVTAALLAESARHQLMVVGASARPAEDHDGGPLGPIARALLSRAPETVLVVKPRHPVDTSIFRAQPAPDVVLDKWFLENTFHYREFADLDELVRLKQAQGLTIGVALMSTGEAETLPAISRVVQDDLGRRIPLVDDVVLLDTGRSPEVEAAARASGLRVSTIPNGERGRVVWTSLHELHDDLIVWLDTDIRNMHARFVYGLVGPLLREPRIALMSGFYRLPETLDEAAFADPQIQTTELAVRPLLNLYFPELSGLISPLSRERAARRAALTGVRLLSGLGADIGLVLDIYERDGIWALAQTDLDERVGGSAPVAEAARHAFATVQALVARIMPAPPARSAHAAMKLIRHEGERYFIEVVETAETSLPPIAPQPHPAAPLRGT